MTEKKPDGVQSEEKQETTLEKKAEDPKASKDPHVSENNNASPTSTAPIVNGTIKPTGCDLKPGEKKPDPEKKEVKKEVKKTEADLLREKILCLEKKIQDLEKGIEEEKSKYMYLQADMENTRKYYIKQQDVTKNKTKKDIITEFMPIIDSLEYANKSSEKIQTNKDPLINTFVKGFNNLQQNIMAIFDNLKVKPIDALNKKFDYKYHEAVMSMVKDDLPEDQVIQVVQPGYTMNGDVIRPVKVIVSKKSTPPPPPPKPENEKKEEKGKDDKGKEKDNKTKEKEEKAKEEKKEENIKEGKPQKK
jgi:molecular chaperone GrpE